MKTLKITLHNIIISISFTVLLFFNSPSAFSQSPKQLQNNYPIIAEDAAWCWFSDSRAVYYKGMKEAIYYGFINSKGDVMVKSFDLKTKEEITHTLHASLQIDDHNVPTFLFLPDGKILTFYNHHNGDIFMKRSKNAEDITEWEAGVVLLEKDSINRYCYTNPIMLSEEDNRIYLFGRNTVQNNEGIYTDTRIYCIYSDDYGETWSQEVNLLYNSGRNNPQYIKYTSDNKSRIDFLFTNGHPKLGEDISVHHIYYQDGYFSQTNGKKIGTFENLPICIKETDKVYNANSIGVRAWIWDIALDKKNNPVVTYARYPDEYNHEYHYAKWDGNKWIDKKIVNSGSYITIIRPGEKIREAHYSGGIVLDHNNPNNIYLSRNINDKFEIVKCEVKKGGKLKMQSITSNSQLDNIRPYIVDRNPTKTPILLWMAGHYYHYTDYNTGLKILIK
ncbi:BNR-4 repeat-containing protein [Proteiniphilum sp.]|uniref:BNR-4 repeat-containing protein n=1 Tax=Proteiniphilum sp. TaxID=1926877 RepID=UPI003332A623